MFRTLKNTLILTTVLPLLSLQCAHADVDITTNSKDIIPFVGEQLFSFAMTKGQLTYNLKDMKTGADGTFELANHVLHVRWDADTKGRVVVINKNRLCAAMDDVQKFHCYRLYTSDKMKAQCAYFVADMENGSIACLKPEIDLTP